MSLSVGRIVRRWRLSKSHSLFSLGWVVVSSGGSRTKTQTALGIGLMAGGVFMRTHRPKRIYSTTIPANGEVRIRVHQGRNLVAGTGVANGKK